MTLIEILSGIETIDNEGKSHSVPVYQSELNAEVQFETEQDISYPSIEITKTKDVEGCSIWARSLFVEEINQIVEQILMRFDPRSEHSFRLDKISNNEGCTGVNVFEFRVI